MEEVLNVPNRLTDKPLQLTVVDEAGAEHTVYMRRHHNAQQPHISEDFVKLERKTQNLATRRASCATRTSFFE